MPQTANATPYRDSLLKALADPVAAVLYLNACVEDQDPRVSLIALRDVADAQSARLP